jgi:excisionase family DNA binding protein
VKKSEKVKPAGFITTGRAADHCRVTIPTVKAWIRAGQLRAFLTPGDHRRIDVDEFERFLREHGMPPYRARPPRVLIVDDDPAIVEFLASVLAKTARPPVVDTATDGYQGLVKLGAFMPALLVLDVSMPRIDGVEVCRRLRASAETRNLKILGITGHQDRVADFVAAGVDDFLIKPFLPDQFTAAVDRLLAAPLRGDQPRGPAEGRPPRARRPVSPR